MHDKDVLAQYARDTHLGQMPFFLLKKLQRTKHEEWKIKLNLHGGSACEIYSCSPLLYSLRHRWKSNKASQKDEDVQNTMQHLIFWRQKLKTPNMSWLTDYIWGEGRSTIHKFGHRGERVSSYTKWRQLRLYELRLYKTCWEDVHSETRRWIGFYTVTYTVHWVSFQAA